VTYYFSTEGRFACFGLDFLCEFTSQSFPNTWPAGLAVRFFSCFRLTIDPLGKTHAMNLRITRNSSLGCWTLKSLACCAMMALLFSTGRSLAQTVTVHADVVGETPRLIGLNSGNWIPGANTISYWRWTGVNAARIFTSAPSIEQDDDIPGQGDGVNSGTISLRGQRDCSRLGRSMGALAALLCSSLLLGK